MLESVSTSVTEEVQRKYLTDLERETAYIEIYVNCNVQSSWEDLAKALYKHKQVAAVEEVRSYLSPRGEPDF